MSTVKKNEYIDFDLQFEDFKKVTILVINLLDEENLPSSIKKYDCNIFDEKECHHKENHSNLNELCSFCEFVKFLRENSNEIRVSSDNFMNIKYKTHYSPEILDWSEFQVRRSPLVLFGYATCQNQSELLYAVKVFENFKILYKKTLVTSKIFLNLQMSKDEKLTLVSGNSDHKGTMSVPKYDMHPLETNSKISEQNFDNISISSNLLRLNSNDIENYDSFDQNQSLNYETSNLTDNNADLFNQSNKISLNGLIDDQNIQIAKCLNLDKMNRINIESIKPELESKFKTLNKEKSVIYLEYNLTRLESNESFKIEAIMTEVASFLYKKLTELVKSINPTDEKQHTQYSEILKTPMETKGINGKASGSTLSESCSLSIKVINKTIAQFCQYLASSFIVLASFDLRNNLYDII